MSTARSSLRLPARTGLAAGITLAVLAVAVAAGRHRPRWRGARSSSRSRCQPGSLGLFLLGTNVPLGYAFVAGMVASVNPCGVCCCRPTSGSTSEMTRALSAQASGRPRRPGQRRHDLQLRDALRDRRAGGRARRFGGDLRPAMDRHCGRGRAGPARRRAGHRPGTGILVPPTGRPAPPRRCRDQGESAARQRGCRAASAPTASSSLADDISTTSSANTSITTTPTGRIGPSARDQMAGDQRRGRRRYRPRSQTRPAWRPPPRVFAGRVM
jgi:hypothetical protein